MASLPYGRLSVSAITRRWHYFCRTVRPLSTAPQHLVCRAVQSLHTNHMQMSIIEVFICRRLHMNTSMIPVCIWLICRLCTALYTKCCGAVLRVYRRSLISSASKQVLTRAVQKQRLLSSSIPILWQRLIFLFSRCLRLI